MKKLTEYNKRRINSYFLKLNRLEKLSKIISDPYKISKKYKIHKDNNNKPKCNLHSYHILTKHSSEVTCKLCQMSMN